MCAKACRLALGLLVLAAVLGALSTARADREVRTIQQAAKPPEQRMLTVTVGEQTSISAENVRSYSEGTGGIIDVRLPQDASQFVIVGKKPGNTTLLLIMQDGNQVQYRVIVKSSYGHNELVERKDNVRIDFYFVQLSERYGHQLGIGWPSSVSAGTFAGQFNLMSGSFNNATISVVDQALPRLDLAQSDGWAKILRHTAMITANGNEAKFNSGGEVNISVQGALTAEIRRIEFGSIVRVLPRYDRDSRRMELTIMADVSELAEAGPNGVPGRTVANIETVVNLELGQSLVLAGLDAQTQRRGRSGLPGLSQIPFLGGLFGSHTRQSEDTKNILIMVPSVVQSLPSDARRQIRQALEVYTQYRGKLEKTTLPAVAR